MFVMESNIKRDRQSRIAVSPKPCEWASFAYPKQPPDASSAVDAVPLSHGDQPGLYSEYMQNPEVRPLLNQVESPM